jgi:luciferase family oxidoreductase group 1
MASTLKLGVLDQSPIPDGRPAGAALRNSIDLARLADELGYHRYWVAEHHGTPGLACTSPEILIGQIAAATSAIRVGSGGVMLPHYSPLKVAENFAILTGLFPGRIDLGVGRAAGTDPATTLALQRDRRRAMPDDFPEQFGELLGYFEGGPGAMRLPGGRPDPCEVWLLGSSPQSAIWAAELGLPYAFADFINPDGAPLAALYRERFTPGVRLAEPRVAVAGWAVCADTDDEAQALTASWRMLISLLHRGRLIAVPSVETAQAFLAAEGSAGGGLPQRRRTITGTPARVKAGIEALSDEYQADEVLLVNILYDHAARRRSYELIAREFGL